VRAGAALAVAAAAVAVTGCTSTVDSLGYDGPGGIVLHPLTGPSSYPNAFRDLLGKSDSDIATKLSGAFMQLFHGDASTQAIYFTMGTDQAYIEDVYHGDVRTEGVGLGMLIAVEMNKQDEFDRLWRYAKGTLAVTSGPSAGYFNSYCQITGTLNWETCLDPFGLEQFVMALLLANDRWGSTTGTIDYGSDVKGLLTLMRHKEDQNGGVVGGVTDTFDPSARLVFDIPDSSAAGMSRPSIELPAYYDLWAQATGDPFWTAAAAAARGYWTRTANMTTGLMPVRASFDGTPLAGDDDFGAQTYRAQLAIALDQIWPVAAPASSWNVDESNRLLQFFNAQGIDQYASGYSLDGSTVTMTGHDPALVVMNGASALVATGASRTDFVSAVWNLATPTGSARYYPGLLDLLSLLALSGQLQVY
jgi:oligosaccharide reducing-end xylanase